jgi:antitoxin HigA-1
MQQERASHPGMILKERFLDPLGLAPADLAASIGTSARRVADIIRGKRGISADTAARLGLYFGVPAAWWLDMQARYDTEGAPWVEELREQVTPRSDLAELLVTRSGVRRMPPSGPPAEVGLVGVSLELLQRLRAQTSVDGPRAERLVRTVTYQNGATALVGIDDAPAG